MGEEVSFRVKEEGAKWGLEWRNRNFQDSDIEDEVRVVSFEMVVYDMLIKFSRSIGIWS